jgi:putative cell wall-binding protein
MIGMSFWLIIRLLKDAVLIVGGVAAIVLIYRKAKRLN